MNDVFFLKTVIDALEILNVKLIIIALLMYIIKNELIMIHIVLLFISFTVDYIEEKKFIYILNLES